MRVRIPVLLLLAGLATSACEFKSSKPTWFDASLSSRIGAAVEQAARENQSFRLESVTSFTWDLVVMFGPYTSQGEISKTLPVSWDHIADAADALAHDESICVWIFIAGNRVVRALRHYRSDGDCSRLADPLSFTPDQAIFTVKQEGATIAGEPFLVLSR